MSVRHQGAILLNTRINHFDGHPPKDRTRGDNNVWNSYSEFWTVVRHSAKGELWARSTHGAARISHKVRYQLVATHIATGEVVKVTVWKCARRAHSEVRVGKRPNRLAERCWLCSKV